jgi:hypothetical protein
MQILECNIAWYCGKHVRCKSSYATANTPQLLLLLTTLPSFKSVYGAAHTA